MRHYQLYVLIAVMLATCLIACKKKSIIPSTMPVYNYFPMNLNNEWVYAINDVYNGLDTLHVRVIAKYSLSNNLPCWAMSYTDLIGLYKDTNYIYINADTIITYTDTNVNSLSEKWIMTDVKNNTWYGIDTFDKYYYQMPIDSFDPYGITYYNIWNIRRDCAQNGYSDIEQLFFEANIGLCFFSVNEFTTYPVRNQQWHLISYQLH
jgi:hypothetical protein